MGLSRTVSDINGDFCRKSAFLPPRVFITTGWRRFPWNWVSELVVKNLEWWCYRAGEEDWRHLQPAGYNTPTWQMDRWTGVRQQRPHLHIVSRVSNTLSLHPDHYLYEKKSLGMKSHKREGNRRMCFHPNSKCELCLLSNGRVGQWT